MKLAKVLKMILN